MNEALQDALSDYYKCKREATIDKSGCEANWKTYIECRNDFEIESLKVNDLIRERKVIVDKIKLFIDTNMTEQPKGKEAMYQESNQNELNMLEIQEKEVKKRLTTYEETKTQKTYQLEKRREDLEHVLKLYQECR